MLASMIGIMAGCVRDQYYYGISAKGTHPSVPCAVEANNPIAFGGDHPRVDKIEKVVQAPRRFLKDRFGNKEQAAVRPEQSRQEAVAVSQQYLIDNGLNDVCIDARCYEPKEQWRRLRENERVAPFWKYTAGTLDVVGYTLLPKRALHVDVYSPFTNTLSINSTEPCDALFQSARAKEYRKQRWLGTYAVLQHAPVASVIHHVNAASDVLTYAEVRGRSDLIRELYPNTYSEIGSAVVSDVMVFVPIPNAPPLTTPVAKAAGKVTGRLMGNLMVERNELSATNDPQMHELR